MTALDGEYPGGPGTRQSGPGDLAVFLEGTRRQPELTATGEARSPRIDPSGLWKTGTFPLISTRKPWWARRWCGRHSRTRFESEVSPPSAQ